MAALYKRVVLKLSGEALKGSAASGIDFSVLQFIAREVQQLLGLGVQVGVVIGGGNIWRGANAEGTGLDRATADYMGMLATIMNGLALQSAFQQVGLEARACRHCVWIRSVSHTFASALLNTSAGIGSSFS